MSLSPAVESYLKGLEPDPELSVWEWADRHFILTSKSAKEVGPWRTERIPYAYEIMNALSAGNRAQSVVVMKGAQLGLTEVGNAWMGYLISSVPAPILCVQSTEGLAKRFSKQRLAPIIEKVVAVREKVAEAKSRDSANTLLSKDFDGGMLAIAGANSAAGLASMPVRNVFADEIDRWPKDIDGEGSPLDLAKARTSTFENTKKIFVVSTPTIDGQSAIQAEFEVSSRERFHVPCPHCSERQVLEWSQIRYNPERIRETIHYQCLHCAGKIYEHHKTQMLKAGVWIAEKPDEKFVRGFHISSLYSPDGFKSWATCAIEYEKARKDTDKLKVWTNTVLGLTYREAGEAPDFQRLYERREDYQPRQLPLGAVLICGGIDVQKDRVECALVAYNELRERWLVDYKICQGDVEQEAVWDELAEYLDTDWPVEGSDLTTKVWAFAIDTGFATLQVTKFAKRFSRKRCFPIKGIGESPVFISQPRQGEIKVNGKKVKSGLRIWNVSGDIAKSELFRHLVLPMPEDGHAYPRGYFHFHQDLSLDWFKGLCSEELRMKTIKGFPKYFFEKVYRRNEPLDCVVYSRAALSILGVDRWKDEHWARMREDLGVDAALAQRQALVREEEAIQVATEVQKEESAMIGVRSSAVPTQKAPAQQRPRERRRSSFW